MPQSCSAINCKNRRVTGEGVSFHKFPREEEAELLKKWLVAVRRENWKPTKSSALCSAHFEKKYFSYNNGRSYLQPNSVPTIFNFPPPSHLTKQECVSNSPKQHVAETLLENTLKDESHQDYQQSTETLSRTINHDHQYIVTSPQETPSENTLQEKHQKDGRQKPAKTASHPTNHDHQYIVPVSQKMLECKTMLLQQKCKRLQQALKLSQQKVQRQSVKITKLQKIIQDLSKRFDETGFHFMEIC